MKSKRQSVLVAWLCAVLILLVVPFGMDKAESAGKPKKIVLKTVTLLKRGHAVNYPIHWIAEQVKERSKGELEIKVMGGPESIRSFDQTEALLRGTIDIYMTGSSYVQTVWPEAIVLPLSRITPTQERETGAFDILQDSAKKRGLYYLGRAVYPRGYYMFVNVPVKGLDDLKGRKIRGAPIYARFLKAMGISMVTTPFREVYTAVERGVIEGYCWPPSICDYRLHEVTKYIINHPFYGANILVATSVKTWNKLPKHLQDLLLRVVKEQETGLENRWRDLWTKELNDIRAGGVKFINFSDSDAKRYVDLAYSSAWEEVLEKSPEYGPRLKEFMTSGE